MRLRRRDLRRRPLLVHRRLIPTCDDRNAKKSQADGNQPPDLANTGGSEGVGLVV
jgi:hypothetical protein